MENMEKEVEELYVGLGQPRNDPHLSPQYPMANSKEE
jgi:hypothetical protein